MNQCCYMSAVTPPNDPTHAKKVLLEGCPPFEAAAGLASLALTTGLRGSGWWLQSCKWILTTDWYAQDTLQQSVEGLFGAKSEEWLFTKTPDS